MNATEERLFGQLMHMLSLAHEILPETMPEHLAHLQPKRDAITRAVVHGDFNSVPPAAAAPTPPIDEEGPPVIDGGPVDLTPNVDHPIAAIGAIIGQGPLDPPEEV